MSTCKDLKSTDGILSHCKTVLDIAIVYLGVYHAPLTQSGAAAFIAARRANC
jgi:hypothetical protein